MSTPRFLSIITQCTANPSVTMCYNTPNREIAYAFKMAFYRWRARSKAAPPEAHCISIIQKGSALHFIYTPDTNLVPLEPTTQPLPQPLDRPSGAPIPDDPGSDLIRKIYGQN